MKRIRYLLGLCSPAEREQVESEYFESEDAFQEMLTAEDDLIDAYARGELMGEECQAFQKNFVSSLHERDRVRFARAFATAVPATRPVKTKLPRSVLYTFQSPVFLRTATVAAMIVIAAMFAWLVTDRRKMTNELRDLRAEFAELHKRTEALQNRDIQGPRTALLPEQPPSPREQPEKLMHRVRGTTATQRAGEKAFIVRDASLGNTITIGQIPVLGRKFEDLLSPQSGTLRSSGTTIRGIAMDQNGNAVSGANVTLSDTARNFTRAQTTNKDGAYVFTAVPPGTYSIRVEARGFKASLVSGLTALADMPMAVDIQLEVGTAIETVSVIAAADTPINTRDATIGNSFEQRRITELPLNANNVVGLLSLQPAVTSAGFVNGGRSDQASITLDGVDVNECPLTPFNISSSGETNIHVQSSLSWIRFQIMLEKPLKGEDFRVTIKPANGGSVTSVDWSEPLTPNQTIIDTPYLSTTDLHSGDYVLLLLGKEPDGSFVKVAEYSFRVIKY